ncbi:MAG: hypothetical protein IJZ95_07500 [Oscillospiraceae bacterium]|nr:hypothetical protein [Oscillospiraceae bacterium]
MVVVMGGDPDKELIPEAAEQRCSEVSTELELASLYATVSNKAWYIEDNIYDFNEGTDEYRSACDLTRRWFALEEKLRTRIFAILISEGVTIPQKGQNQVIIPFMKRNGFLDMGGWWIAENELKATNRYSKHLK